MKKHTRLLARIMSLVMIFNCFSCTVVSAEEVGDAVDLTAVTSSSDVCNIANHDDWQALTTETIGDFMTLSAGHYYLNAGSYYLDDDLEMGVTIYIWPGTTVDLCLNGYDIIMQYSNRTILNPKNSATLNLYDCSTKVRYYDENGWVTAPTDGWDAASDEAIATALADTNGAVKIVGGAIYGATSFDKGGAGVFIQNYATFNMYGGNILGCSCSTASHYGGGVYNYEGTFNMYNGVIAYNSSSSYAGGVFVRTGSTMNMYGGEIAYNYAPIEGAGVYSGGVFTMSGDASIHDNYGSYTGSGFYNAGGGTLNMTKNSSIYANISGDGGGAGVYMPSYNSILNMSGTSSITDNISTGIAPGVYFVSGAMTISGDAEVSGNYVVDSVTIDNLTEADGTTPVTTENGIALKVVDAIGAKVVDSNVYLSNGKTITFDNYDGNDVYVTSANGLGLVATSVDGTDSGNLSSDVATYYAVRKTDNTEVHLVEAETLAGDTATKVYASGTIDLSDLRMFDVISDDTTYTITGGTGSGTIDGKELSVDSIGTFIIEAVTPASNTYPLTTQTSTLTVTPASVTYSGITTIGSVVGDIAELSNTSGTLAGVVNGDNVSIDFSAAYGSVSAETYVDGQTYDVTIHGISITGDDAGNYTLSTTGNTSTTTVTVKIATPLISWPTAQDITYGVARTDGDLLGGKVMIKYDGDYTTVTGNFVWANDDANEDAGTHTYEVWFDVDSSYDNHSIYDAETITAIEAMRHNVTQVVQPVEVTFTIGDSIIGDATNVVYDLDISTTPSTSDYVLWYCNVDGGSWSKDIPTTGGSYLLGAEFTSDNYRHAGTQESTAKQIGAFVIYETTEPTTYTVTFKVGEEINSTIENALPQTIHILPTLEGAYTGWLYTDGTIYDFGSRFAQPEGDATFTAVAANANATLSGTITGTDLDGDKNTGLSGVVVTLMQGAEQIAVDVTDEYGDYSFTVPQGRYNVVVTRDQVIRNEITLYVNLDSAAESVDVEIPDIRQNTIFNVASGMTAITIKGMKDLIDGETVSSYKVELNPSSDTAAILAKVATDYNLTANNAKLYIDVSIQEREANDASYDEINLSGSDTLTLYIPLAGVYQGHSEYYVCRYDGETVEILSDDSEDTEYMSISEGDDLLTLVVQKSGVYGLVFMDIEDDVTPGEVPSLTTTYGDTDTISTTTLFSHIENTGDRSYSITSSDGGVATIDGNGNVTVTKVGTFTVTVKVVKTSGYAACTSTATLTVSPKTVTISGITCEDQEVGDIIDSQVPLNTGGLLSGVETGDSVQIDFTRAVGTIDSSYASDETLTTTGINTFTVTVSGLDLTGTDAGNYTISTAPTSQVTVNKSLVYIAWPAAHDIVYGETQTDGDLYGGKVVVYNGSTYTDITDDGTFQWVAVTSSGGTVGSLSETTIATDAGTYTYDVQFVGDTENAVYSYDESASYYTALSSATQIITQVVEPAAVTFTIRDSALEDVANAADVVTKLGISATDENDNPVTSGNYYLQYADASATTITPTYVTPTTTGTYYLYAEFTTSNYRHAGTQVSTGKQIGVFTIGVENPTTYDVTFMVNDVENVEFAISDALPQSIHILPTLIATLDDGVSAKYIGWQDEAGITYDFGERYPQPEKDVILTAIPAPTPVTISGTVTGTDINGSAGGLSRVGVALYQGSTLVDYGETATSGEGIGTYSFDVLPGMYNLVVTYNLDTTIEQTAFVDATTANVEQDFEFTAYIQNIVQDYDAGLPDMVVSGLDSLLDTSQNSEIQLDVTASTNQDAIQTQIKTAAAEAGISADELKQFFNIDISSRYDEEASFTPVTATGNLLTFYIPLTGIYQGHDEYTVYRYHDEDGDGIGEVQTLTEEENSDGEYIVVSDTNLIIVAKYFSLYGIAFANETVATVTPYKPSSSTSSTTTATTSELPFTDVSVDDWFYEDVLYLYELGLMTGTSATTFSPYDGNSRAMVAQMMYNLEGQPERTEFDFFPDVVEGQWYEPAINWCASHGVVDGYLDGLYRPDTIISRQEFTNVLYDHCLHLGYDVSSLDDLSAFADSPSDWAKTYMMWAVEVGILQGDTDGYLNSSNQLTRCEAAAMFARFLRNVYEA